MWNHVLNLDHKDRKVIFQDNTIGISTDNLKAALEQFVAGKPITAESQVALTPNQTLPTDFLPNDIQKAVKAELSKKTTLVFFKSTDCTICTPWSESLDSYFEKWKSKGYGIVLVTDNQSDYGMKTNRNILEISDKSTSTPDRSEIFTAWNVRGFPAAYLLENGKYKGWVSFRSMKTDNGHYFDIQMKAIDVLLKNRSNAQKG